MTPTARTLAECRKRGWIAQVVEQTIPRTFIKRDLFGCIDIVAVTPEGIVGIQATSNLTGGNHGMRVQKILAEPRMREWCRHARCEVFTAARRQECAMKNGSHALVDLELVFAQRDALAASLRALLAVVDSIGGYMTPAQQQACREARALAAECERKELA